MCNEFLASNFQRYSWPLHDEIKRLSLSVFSFFYREHISGCGPKRWYVVVFLDLLVWGFYLERKSLDLKSIDHQIWKLELGTFDWTKCVWFGMLVWVVKWFSPFLRTSSVFSIFRCLSLDLNDCLILGLARGLKTNDFGLVSFQVG